MQAPTANSLNQADARYNYRIVGGKPGALVEQLQIDCATKQLALSRQTQEKTPVYRHEATASAEQCKMLANLAEPLCEATEKQQPGVFDAAGYSLSCKIGEMPAVSFSWQGTLRAAPEGLRPWHDYTRSLIKTAFPGVNAYP